MTDITYRDLRGMAEFRAAEDLQRDVWGAGDQPDPADLMMVIQAEGGLVGGAFAGDRLLGYVFAFPTREAGAQHSHRLAVRAEARGLGLGVKLKLWQRDWCLTRGITLVRWTYDPLRATNAALNIARLGASAATYHVDYYGEMEGINRGVASDRLLAEWRLDAPAATPGKPLDIALPEDFGALLVQDPPAAAALRLQMRAALLQAFGRGQRITGYDRARRVYLLSDPV